jgi:ABC-type multidrug transport system fused ATPase/permease subunit
VWTRALQADGLISKDPLGLDARISSSGSDLSAGERQLLCLARALLHRARIILLDEATAALDDTLMVSTELALKACAQSATVIQIAHQTMAVADCDRVVVLHAGEVVEDGAPQHLLTTPTGHFATMVRHDARRGSIVNAEGAPSDATGPISRTGSSGPIGQVRQRKVTTV